MFADNVQYQTDTRQHPDLTITHSLTTSRLGYKSITDTQVNK